MFERVAIIGFGLIGSSVARAIRATDLAQNIVCGDVSAEVCDVVRTHHLADFATTDLALAADGADLVMLAVPVRAYADVLRKIAPQLKPGCIVSDVGSVKGAVVAAVQALLPNGVHFVPGHPISGSEHSGPLAGLAELFVNRWCILTPEEQTDTAAIERVRALWAGMGARVALMPPRQHDLTLAITSHLPHLIAYTIVATATDLGEDLQAEVIKYSAGGFRDFTRIAASDPTMWRDIFLSNREAVLEMLQRFNEDLTDLQKAIRNSDGDHLFDVFTRTRAIRRQIIDQGQADYRSPTGLEPHTPPVTGPDTGAGGQAAK